MALSIFLMILLLLLLPFSLFFLIYSKRKPKLNLPPGPRPSPIIGNLLQVGDIAHRTCYELSKIYGPIFYMRLGRIPLINVSSPALAEEVLRKLDLVCCTRSHMAVLQEYTFNYCNVSSAPYGHNWRILRKVYTLELLSNKKLSFFRRALQTETEKMIESIQNRPGHASSINIKDFMLRYSNNMVWLVTFGSYMNEGINCEQGQFCDMLQEAYRMFYENFVGDYFPGFGWIDWLTGKRKRLQKNAKEMGDLFQQMIDKRKDVTKRGGGEDHEECFIDAMIRLCEEEGSQITTDHIKGSILDIMNAGTDTSAATVTWAMTELARHPRVMKKAQEELRRVVGDKAGKVEESDLPHCKYLKLVVNETLRLHPQDLILRETMQDCEIGGYDIPKGTRVFVNTWEIGRDKASWENAMEFLPERFEGSSINFWGNDFQYLPFGAGRRACPGINFGVHIVSLALANLLYTFDWELPIGVKERDIDIDEAPGFTTYNKTPLLLVPKNKY